MHSLLSSTYLSRGPIEAAMHAFAARFTSEQHILDIGCGTKPYANLFTAKYTGVDPLDTVKPDIVAPAWDVPVESESFDGVILNQSLEHIRNTEGTIKEIMRVLKPGGICIITVPHTMKNHSEPIAIQKTQYAKQVNSYEVPYWQEDYYRFTKFGLISLFKDFHIETIKETSGYGATIMQLLNYFFSSLGSFRWIFTPFFFVNNIIGIILDTVFKILSNSNLPIFSKIYHLIYLSLPLNYILVIRKPLNS